jgi:hypothetical protein
VVLSTVMKANVFNAISDAHFVCDFVCILSV